MPARRTSKRVAPDPPDLPDDLAPAPAGFTRDTDWYGLAADVAMTLPETVYDLDLTGCLWRGVNARGRRFGGLRSRDVVFDHCDFAEAGLEGALLTRVRFHECRLTGANFGGAVLHDVLIDGGVADLTSFRLSRCSMLWAVGTTLQEADFAQATLRRCALLDSDLTSASFDKVSLDGLSLHGSILDALVSAQALAGGGVRIDTGQVLPLGSAILAAMGVQVGDRPELPAVRRPLTR